MNTKEQQKLIDKLGLLVQDAGGEAFYVGGYVRDKFLAEMSFARTNEIADVDIEVHGIGPDDLFAILKKVGEPLTIGKSFGIYTLRGANIDIAMPRIEENSGRGHRNFDVFVDPNLGTYSAAKRRDFTINSIMQNVVTGEIIDHFNGCKDLKERIIRHVDDNTFADDPLRVLRGAQFASRFEFEVDESTIELCKGIDLVELSRERVEGELRKALIKGDKPSLFFEVLRAANQLDTWFPELKDLIGLEQDPIYHPEGDVWIHTMEVLDRASSYRDKVSDPYSFMLLAMTHDLGKITTTEFTKGRIHAYRHETEGMPLVLQAVRRITNEKAVIKYVKNMVPLHMRPNIVAYSKSSIKSTNHMFDEAIAPLDLIYFAMADKPVVVGADPFAGNFEFLIDRLDVYNDVMSKPYVTGKDLIAEGLKPDENFKFALEYAHKLRLAGVDKKSSLKQTLSYARKSINKGVNKDGKK